MAEQKTYTKEEVEENLRELFAHSVIISRNSKSEKDSEEESENNTFTCCICGKTVREFGNNPWPFEGKKCCCSCNWERVVPARLALRA